MLVLMPCCRAAAATDAPRRALGMSLVGDGVHGVHSAHFPHWQLAFNVGWSDAYIQNMAVRS